MKKNILVIAAALMLSMTACQKEDIVTPGTIVAPGTTNVTPGNSGNNGNNAAKVQTTSDLHNTNWTYTMTYNEFLSNLGIDTTCMSGIEDDTMSFNLNFDGTYAHFTFPTNIMAFGGNEGMLEQIQGVSYTYSYDGTTHTGYLDGVVDPEDDDVPSQLQFTYNDTTDVITFVLNLFYAEDETPVTLTLNFARNNE